MNDYKHITTEVNYIKLLKTGMFFEFYPELTGNWCDDEIIINKTMIDIEDYNI